MNAESGAPDPDCEECDGEGWVWEDDEGGSFDCRCTSTHIDASEVHDG